MPKIKKKARMSDLPTFIQNTGVSSQCNNAEKEIKYI